MTKRLPDKNPAALNEGGIRRFWLAIIKQATDDLHNGGLPARSPESKNAKQERVLEAYHWLMTERSDDALRVQNVDGESFREILREKIKSGQIVIHLNRKRDKRKVVMFPPPRRRQVKIAA